MKDATDPHADPDRGLVLACQDALRAGRTPPFAELCERHYERVYRRCVRVLGNEFDARDASQETFHAVLRKIASFQHRARFTTWLRNVTLNCCRDVARSRYQRTLSASVSSADQDEAARTSDHVEEGPATRCSRLELEALVEQSIARLSPTLRKVVETRYFAHCSYEDIAGRLGIALGTVKSRLSRAHEILKDSLAGRIDVDELAGCELN